MCSSRKFALRANARLNTALGPKANGRALLTVYNTNGFR
jgi:hypothetical protein